MESSLVLELLASQKRIEGQLQSLSGIDGKLRSLAGAVEEVRCAIRRRSVGSLPDTTVPETLDGAPSNLSSRKNSYTSVEVGPAQRPNPLTVKSLNRSMTGDLAAVNGDLVAFSLPRGWPGSLPLRKIGGRSVVIQDMDWEDTENMQSHKSSVARKTTSMHKKPLSQWPKLQAINPNSAFGMTADVLCVLVLLLELTTVPYMLAWGASFTGYAAGFVQFSTIFWTLDIPRTFLTAIYRDGVLETRLKVVSSVYLRSWFAIDATLVASDWLALLIDSAGNGSRMFRANKMGRMLRIIGIVRMLRFVRVLEDFLDRSVSESFRLAMRIISILFGIIWLTHLMCCAWFAIGQLDDSDTGASWTDFDVTGAQHFLDDSTGHAYQYLTSFHWAVAQLTLGSIEVDCKNSIERVYTVVCLLVGLLFGSAVISSMSAAMVELQAMKKDQTQKLEQLRQFMRQNPVEGRLANEVQRQVVARLRQRVPLHEKDVPALQLLSASLRADLRYAIFEPCVRRHPLFRLWSRVDVSVLRHLCETAEYLFLSAQDDLFSPSTKSEVAYFLVSGTLEYIQEPGTAPVGITKVEEVSEGSWLCKAAFWCEWIHVGRAMAKTPCKVMTMSADAIFQNMTRHALIEQMTKQYGKAFQLRLLRAEPPHTDYPTDLEVPYTDFADLVYAMNRDSQLAISQIALQRLRQQRDWNSVKRLVSTRDMLMEEVSAGKAILIETETGEIQRVVSVVCARVHDCRGRLFAQIGKYEDGELRPMCQLPGSKPEDREPLMETFERVVSTKLPWLEGLVEVECSQREVTVKELAEYYGYKLTRKYYRTVFYAALSEGFSAPAHRPAEGAKATVLRHSFLERDVYISESMGKAAFYTLLEDDEFDELSSGGCHAELEEWLRLLHDSRPAEYGLSDFGKCERAPSGEHSASVHEAVPAKEAFSSEASTLGQGEEPPLNGTATMNGRRRSEESLSLVISSRAGVVRPSLGALATRLADENGMSPLSM